MAGHWIIFQRRILLYGQVIEAFSHIVNTGNQPDLIPEGSGIIASASISAESGAFADSAVEAKCPVLERYLTADTKLRVL